MTPDVEPEVRPPWRDRLRHTRTRFEDSGLGHLQRRVVDTQLTKQALILAALAFMLVIPALVTLAAVVPLGRPGGGVSTFATRLGLTPQATWDLQQLFPTTTTVSSASTWFSVLLTVVITVRWPLALQRGYELVWDLPHHGIRTLWRPLAWLAGFLALVAVVVLVGPVDGGLPLVLVLVVGTPLAMAWAWWTQYLLLGGRVPWTRLLPGAIVVGIGLAGLRMAAPLVLSPQISSHYRQFGPLGIVFVILSWFVAFGVVMLGGALVGHLVAVGILGAHLLSPRGDEVAAVAPDESPGEPTTPAVPVTEGGSWHRGG
jgi:membrane protein